MLSQVALEGISGDCFEDGSQQTIAAVGITVLFSGIGLAGSFLQVIHILAAIARFEFRVPPNQPGCMGKQVMDGGNSEFPGKCSEVLANGIGSPQLALEFQLQNRGRCKLLCHRRDEEQGVRRVWDSFGPSTVPVGLSQYWVSSIEQEKPA